MSAFYENVIARVQARAVVAHAFFILRAKHPQARAIDIWEFITRANGESFDEFMCGRRPGGHDFTYTGTNYGGDDARWHGEGRCLCSNCGMDGDA